jgi:two-component system, NarL family, nitrate/nitrite response regulator NarL
MTALDMAKPQQNKVRSDPPLTTREQDVARLVASGLSNKAIALRLGLREGTVKVHLHNIYQKLGISSRVGLILMTTPFGNK